MNLNRDPLHLLAYLIVLLVAAVVVIKLVEVIVAA